MNPNEKPVPPLAIPTFFNLSKIHDSLITVYKEQEYIFYQSKPLNFNIDQFRGRKSIEPVYRNTNGCYITPRENYRQNRIYFGEAPFYFEGFYLIHKHHVGCSAQNHRQQQRLLGDKVYNFDSNN